MTALTAIGRAAAAVRNAQTASDRLTAFVATHADAGAYLRSIADDLATELALAEASLLAAQPALSQNIVIGADSLGKITPSALWLNLGGEAAQ